MVAVERGSRREDIVDREIAISLQWDGFSDWRARDDSPTNQRREDLHPTVCRDPVAAPAATITNTVCIPVGIDVLKLMAQGKSNKEIATPLFITEGTVKSHGKSIFTKMSVSSRTEAVAGATRRGFLRL